ncbi:MAG: AI-2E family transporter YdiK [Burkholderiales bacterium]
MTTEPVKVDPVQPAGARPGADLARTTLGVFFMAGLAAAALWIVKPFVPAFVWATMIVVAVWPLMLRLQASLNGKRWAAVTVMTLGLLLTLVVPLSLAVTAVVAHTEDIGGWAQSLRDLRLPPPPAWVERLPMVGPRVSAAWNEIVVAAPAELAQKLEPYARDAGRWLLANIGSVGALIVEFLLMVVIAAILFARGETAAAGVLGFFRRLAGAHGEEVVILASRAIRSVALGVVLTALVQSVLGGIGLALAGVPFAGLLTAIMLVLALAQIGAAPVLIAAVVWLYWTRDSAWVPTALLIWAIFVGAIDNVLRPILIQRSGHLPLLIVFAGVVGGLLSLGLIGIFLGPIVLAVVYTLLKAWVGTGPQCDQSPLVRREPLP